MWLLIIIVLIAIYYFYFRNEQFATKASKANAITNWFANTPNPLYTNYRDAMDGKSNVVEYEYALAAARSGKLTPDAVMKIL